MMVARPRSSLTCALLLALALAKGADAGIDPPTGMMRTGANASANALQNLVDKVSGSMVIVPVVGDGVADDWQAIQDAIDNATAPAVIAIPPKPNVRISQALRMRDQVTLLSLDWNQKWTCSGDAGGAFQQWPFYGCLMFGSAETANFDLMTPIDVNDPAAGDTVLTFSGGDYTTLDPAVGDLIAVGASAMFTIPDILTDISQTAQVQRIVAVNAGANQVTVSSPTEVATTGTQVWKLTNNGLTARNAIDVDTGVPMWATYRAAVIGGEWTGIGAVTPFAAGGGALEPTIRIKSFTGSHGFGWNLYGGAHAEAEALNVSRKGVELARNSHGNTIRIGRLAMTGTDTPPWILAAVEGARGNRVEATYVNTGATTPDYLVSVNRAAGNNIRVGTAVGAALTWYPIIIRSSDYVGSPPDTRDNFVQIDANEILSVTSYAVLEGIYQGVTATISAAGSGYTNGDVVTQATTGGSCSVAPTWTLTVGGGTVTAATIADAGRCKTRPTNPVAVSGGSGSGLTLTVTYAGSTTVNNTIGYGVHRSAITQGGSFAWFITGVGAGNWVSGWGANGTISQDAPSSTASGFRNLRDANGHYLASGTMLLPSGAKLAVGIASPVAELEAKNATGTASIQASGNFAALRALQDNGTGFRFALNNDGIWRLQSTTNSFAGATNRLTVNGNTGVVGYGGLTSAFPGLKPSGTTLQARLADDSGFAPIQGKITLDTAFTGGTVSATGQLVIYDSTGTAYKLNACPAASC